MKRKSISFKEKKISVHRKAQVSKKEINLGFKENLRKENRENLLPAGSAAPIVQAQNKPGARQC